MSVLAVRKCLENRSRLVIDKVTPALASVTQTGPGSSCLCMLNFKDVALRNTGWGEGGLHETESTFYSPKTHPWETNIQLPWRHSRWMKDGLIKIQ